MARQVPRQGKANAALARHTAEEKYGGGTGELKFAYVAERLYEVMPGIFQVFFAAEDIAGWIEDAVTKMKEYLSENENVAALMGGKK